ncbi:TniQ family protein [Pseudomonas sp. D47]|uniref:TniQ family protein n=1 Tax=Pseudomonas sp. D47 TaxID=3159447 RepID=UPI00387B8342
MFDLLINPTPMHDESLIGFLHRLAHSNCLSGGEVLGLFKETSDDSVNEWLDSKQRPLSWNLVAEEIRTPKVTNQKTWSVACSKYCPVCLAEGLYWRELWDLTLYTTCAFHQVELLYNCPKCKAHSSPKVLINKCCDVCGYSVQDSDLLSLTSDDPRAWLSVELDHRVRLPDSGKAKGIGALTYQQLHDLAIRIGVRAVSRKRSITMKVPEVASGVVAPELANSAGSVFRGWPEAFHSLLADLMEIRKSQISWQLVSAFGPIYNDMYLSLNDSCFDFVRQEFERHIIQQWQGPLAKRNRRLSECTLLEHRWLPFSKAKRLTGLPEAFLRRMHSSGDLETREFYYPCGKISTVVDIDQARRLSSVLNEPVNLREASRLLCLSRKRVEQLISTGLLRTLGGSPKAGEQWLISLDSIVDLIPNSFLPLSDSGFITLSQVAKHYLPTADGLPQLLKAIQEGEVPVFCSAHAEAIGIGKWLVSPNVLHQKGITLHASNQTKGLSIAEAAKALGMKEEVAYALVRAGRLGSNVVQCSRRSAHVVGLKDLDHFKRNYILSPEIGQILNTSPKSVCFRLRLKGFEPIAGPSLLKAQCRQNVWRRSKKLTAYLKLVTNPGG